MDCFLPSMLECEKERFKRESLYPWEVTFPFRGLKVESYRSLNRVERKKQLLANVSRGARPFRYSISARCARHDFRYRVSGAVGSPKSEVLDRRDQHRMKWNRRHRITLAGLCARILSSASKAIALPLNNDVTPPILRANKAQRNRQKSTLLWHD